MGGMGNLPQVELPLRHLQCMLVVAADMYTPTDHTHNQPAYAEAPTAVFLALSANSLKLGACSARSSACEQWMGGAGGASGWVQ